MHYAIVIRNQSPLIKYEYRKDENQLDVRIIVRPNSDRSNKLAVSASVAQFNFVDQRFCSTRAT
jgi:hypothetical protein